MAEQAKRLQAERNCRPSLDIPWMRRWEKGEREHSVEDFQTRLVRIDYVNMLQELEFH